MSTEHKCPFQVDVYCSGGRTPLMVAAANSNLPLVQYVFKNYRGIFWRDKRRKYVEMKFAWLLHQRCSYFCHWWVNWLEIFFSYRGWGGGSLVKNNESKSDAIQSCFLWRRRSLVPMRKLLWTSLFKKKEVLVNGLSQSRMNFVC